MRHPVIPHPVAALLFDMDGLLFDTERIYLAALIDAARELGREMAEEFAHSMIGIPGKECDAMIREYFGPSFPMDAYGETYARHKEQMMRQGIPLKSGALELLDFLDSNGIPKAIATSSGRRTADHYLETTRLRSRFDALVTREDVLRAKPHPDPFLRAAELLRVAPARCMVLEDSHFGIRSAHAAGAMPVMVPDLLKATEEMRTLCVAIADDLHGVRSLLEAQRCVA